MELNEKLQYAQEQLQHIDHLFLHNEEETAQRLLNELCIFLVSIDKKEVYDHKES